MDLSSSAPHGDVRTSGCSSLIHIRPLDLYQRYKKFKMAQYTVCLPYFEQSFGLKKINMFLKSNKNRHSVHESIMLVCVCLVTT